MYRPPNRIEPRMLYLGFHSAKMTSAMASQPRSPKPPFVQVPPV